MSAPLCARRQALALLLAAGAVSAETPGDSFAASQRAHYAALCHAHKDLNSCSDAVRWSPGDAALVVNLADALVRAGRIPEAIRDYRRAETLHPAVPGLEARIGAAEAKLAEARRARRKAPAPERIATAATEKHFSNSEPESQSH